MQRLIDLYQLWSWLPHFRAVAETQHVGRAAVMLRMSAPAISRALAKLEAAMGAPLFTRQGRGLVLNPAGEELLHAVREAMRRIDDARTHADPRPPDVVIAGPGPYFSAFVLPSLPCLPVDATIVLQATPARPIEALLRGRIDLCLLEQAIDHPELETSIIATFEKVPCCHPKAPWVRAKDRRAALKTARFVAPPANDRGVRDDGWPSTEPRHVAMTVDAMQTGIDAVQTGRYVAVLPRPILDRAGLVSLQPPGQAAARASLFAAWRRPLAPHGSPAATLVEAMVALHRRSGSKIVNRKTTNR